jgi:hypothetical protein
MRGMRTRDVLKAASQELVAAGEPALSVPEHRRLRDTGDLRLRALGAGVSLNKLTAPQATSAIAKVVRVVRQDRAERAPADALDTIHASLTTKRERECFDRTLKRALDIQAAQQDLKYRADVMKAAQEMAPEQLKAMQEWEAKARLEWHNCIMQSKGIAPHLTDDDYRFLLRVLHPDREPTGQERARGFQIVRSLDGYMEAFRRHRPAPPTTQAEKP